MVEQADRLGIPAFGPITRDRHVGRRGKAGEQRALTGAGRRDHQSNSVLPDPVEEAVDALAREGMHLGYQHLGRYHGRGPFPHAGPPLLALSFPVHAGVATAMPALTPTRPAVYVRSPRTSQGTSPQYTEMPDCQYGFRK